MKTIKISALCFGMALMTASCGTTGTDILSSVLSAGLGAQTGQQATGAVGASTTNSLITGNSTGAQLGRLGVQVLTTYLTNRSQAKANMQKGTAQTYQGTYTAQLLVTQNGNYVNSGNPTTATTSTTLVVGSETVGVSFPAITAGGASMSQVTLNNLSANQGVYGVTTNSTCTEGTLTYGGKTYDLANAYVELQYNGTSSLVYSASIYFDLNQQTGHYNYAMNLTFKK
ncbi:MAG: hypothetical protein KBT12_02885 [Bacteroidales bacterium]|nr:hypothetical protein [Candidatus Physcousia equi]